MASEEIKLSLSEKLGFFGTLGAFAFRAGCTSLRHLIIPPSDSPGIGRSLYTLFLKSTMTLSERQRRGMLPYPKTGEVIKTYCTKHKLKHVTYPLPNGAKLHWIGPQPSPGCNVLLYFHGGGYNIATSPGCITFVLRCAKNAKASLAMLEYTLAPTGHYPTQLHQAIEALRKVLTVTSPSRIIIGGDSAGGHLTTSLLSHLMHPAKNVEPITLTENLAGICLICPFLSFNYNKQSYVTNAKKDYLQLEHMKEFNASFKPPGLSDDEAMKDPGLSPLDAPPGWWKNAPVERTLLTAGIWEVFLDDVIAFSQRLKEEGTGTKVELVVGRKEVHAAPIVDTAFNLKDGNSAKAILAWMGNGTRT